MTKTFWCVFWFTVSTVDQWPPRLRTRVHDKGQQFEQKEKKTFCEQKINLIGSLLFRAEFQANRCHFSVTVTFVTRLGVRFHCLNETLK